MATEVKLLITAIDATKQAFSAVQESAKSAFSAVVNASKTTGSAVASAYDTLKSSVVSNFNFIKTHWLAVSAAITGAWLAVQKAWDMAKETASFQQSMSAFRSVVKSMGHDAEQVFGRIKELSGGIIDNKSLVEAANRAVSLGIPVEKLGDLMQVARAKSRDMGITAKDAFDSIALGIGRASPLFLDNLGIVIKLEDANNKMAQSLGKAASELTSQEQKMALLNATLEAGRESLERHDLSVLTTKERMEQLTASVANLRLEVGGFIIKGGLALYGLFQGLASAIALVGTGFMGIGTVLTWVTDAVHITSGAYDELKMAMMTTWEATKDLGKQAWENISAMTASSEELMAAQANATSATQRAAQAETEKGKVLEQNVKILQEYSKAVEGVGADVLKFAGEEFALNLKTPVNDLNESLEDIKGMMVETQDVASLQATWEKNSRAVRQYEETQKSTLKNLKTVLTEYLETVDAVYAKQVAAQRSVFQQLKATGASPEDMKNQGMAILEAEKTQISTRLGAWQQYYDTLTSLHTTAIDEQKRKTQELLALETQISQQRQGYADLEKSLKDKIFNQNKSEVQKYYDTQRSLEEQYQSALLLNGQARIDALAKYQQAAASAASAVVEDGKEYISLQNASVTALDQVKLAQSEIVAEQDKMVALKQQEIEQTQAWAATLQNAMTEAKQVLESYKAEIIDLSDRMTSLKLTIDTTQAMGAIQAIKREIETPLVMKFYGEGSEIKPISEKVQDIREMIGSIGDERPNIMANFTPLSEQISQMKSSVTQDMQSMFSDFQFSDFKLEPFNLSRPQFDVGTSKLRQSQEIISSLNASLMQIASTASIVKNEIFLLSAAMQAMTLNVDASQVLNQLAMIKTEAENMQNIMRSLVLIINVSQAITALNEVKSLLNSIPDVTRKTVIVQTVQAGAAGGFQQFSGASTLPSYAVGTRYIEEDKVAKLHKGEAVVPLEYNIYQDHSFQDVKNIVQNTENASHSGGDSFYNETAEYSTYHHNLRNRYTTNNTVEQGKAVVPAEYNIYQDHTFQEIKKDTGMYGRIGAGTEILRVYPLKPTTDETLSMHEGDPSERLSFIYGRMSVNTGTEIPRIYTHVKPDMPGLYGRHEDRPLVGRDIERRETTRETTATGRNITINIPKIEIIARENDNPAALARKLVKPLREELRRLKNLH